MSDLAARCLGSWIRLGDHAERDFGVDVSLPDTQSCPLTSGDACRCSTLLDRIRAEWDAQDRRCAAAPPRPTSIAALWGFNSPSRAKSCPTRRCDLRKRSDLVSEG